MTIESLLRPYVIACGAVWGVLGAPRVENALVALSSAALMSSLPSLIARRWRGTQGISWE